MKIIYKRGDALAGPEYFLAHGCNNKGKMGAGIAQQIRTKYKPAYDYYTEVYNTNTLELGAVLGVKCASKYIFNCITQDGYGRGGKKYLVDEAVAACMLEISQQLKQLVPQVLIHNIEVAMPQIGAGLAAGDWNLIEKIIEQNSLFQPVVYIYE